MVALDWWLWLLGVGVRAIGVRPVVLALVLGLALGVRAGSRWATAALVLLAGVVGFASLLAGPVEWLLG